MAGQGTGAKKHVAKLSAEERERLEAVINSGKRSAQLITKARLLLKADTSDAGEGWTDCEIAAALDTSVNTVGSARRQLVEEGLEATLAPKYNPNSARPRIFDGATGAKLSALACSPAPEGFDFIFTAKQTSHKALHDFIAGAELSRHEEIVRRRAAKETLGYHWIEAVPIRDGKDAILVNWIGF